MHVISPNCIHLCVFNVVLSHYFCFCHAPVKKQKRFRSVKFLDGWYGSVTVFVTGSSVGKRTTCNLEIILLGHLSALKSLKLFHKSAFSTVEKVWKLINFTHLNRPIN